ncbi:ATP-binding protein [Mucilaginibacter sp. HMF5004]|uniref:ATP-dependent nuclease n=1 Tax=Mucilaginibacter rivuli TaxID=2857527 RepID=UPI001C5E682A|nr:AAA family ATPase [Mucilaginibacter rivuli]MBW4888323.1 ATP-binding protein [Mucilaginibacter rivuli]
MAKTKRSNKNQALLLLNVIESVRSQKESGGQKSFDAGISEIFSLLIANAIQYERRKQENNIEIEIEKFKKINKAKLFLEPVNIFIGTNNSGKSSFIQGIQFAISSAQTLQLKKANWVKKGDSRTLSLDSSDFLYTPTRQIENLYHGVKLTGARTKNERKEICFKFKTIVGESRVSVARGKNGGFTTTHVGRLLGEQLNSINSPFCVYVPGIAGIPVEEKYEVVISIKKSATRGDSNSYLRNIIYRISEDKSKWERFHTSINRIYPDIVVEAFFDENVSEFINITVKTKNIVLPIDSVGTGVLQTIQIFAYLEYFTPKILLLDEPDSHIHPTKQHLLAKELSDRARKDRELRIVFSTHSRYILDALGETAQVIHFQDGGVFSGIKGSKILLDIGAADADYLFSKKSLKYIIVTEDVVDGVEEKKAFLKKFVIANGLSEDEFVLHSYEGCKKVHFAKLLEGFVRKHIPNVKVIVHVDKDQKEELDRDLQKFTADCENQGILSFITEYSEIENYFCQPKHLSQIYNLPYADCEQIYHEKVSSLEQFTKDKIANFLLRERIELCKNSNNQMDIKIVNANTDKIYKETGTALTPGKELLGKIKLHMQTVLKLNPNLIVDQSSALTSETFQLLIAEEAN